MSTPLLEVNDLKKHFPIRGGFFGGVTGHVYAVDGISCKRVSTPVSEEPSFGTEPNNPCV